MAPTIYAALVIAVLSYPTSSFIFGPKINQRRLTKKSAQSVDTGTDLTRRNLFTSVLGGASLLGGLRAIAAAPVAPGGVLGSWDMSIAGLSALPSGSVLTFDKSGEASIVAGDSIYPSVSDWKVNPAQR